MSTSFAAIPYSGQVNPTYRKAAMTILGDDVRVGIYVRRSTDDEHKP